MPLITKISDAFYSAKESIKKRISAKFKSRDVRVVPDPALQSRQSNPMPPRDLPTVAQRMVNEVPYRTTPHLQPQDEATTPEPDILGSIAEQPDTEPETTDSIHQNPLEHFGIDIPADDENPLDYEGLWQNIGLQLTAELKELHRDARHLRRKQLTIKYAELLRLVSESKIQETLQLLRGVTSLEHYVPAITFLMDPEASGQPTTSGSLPNLPGESIESSADEPPTERLSEQEIIRLMGMILPREHGFTSRQRFNWINKEVKELCFEMHQGTFNETRYEETHSYLHNAYMKMLDLVEQHKITLKESSLLGQYIDQRIKMLEIHEEQDRNKDSSSSNDVQ